MSICLGSIALLLRALSQKVWLFGFLAPEAFSKKKVSSVLLFGSFSLQAQHTNTMTGQFKT